MRPMTMLLVAAFLAVPRAALGQEAGTTEAIAEVTAAWAAAYNAGDGAAIAALYAEDAKLLPPGGELVDGREAIAAFWQAWIDELGSVTDLQTRELEVLGDTAVEVGSYVDSAKDGTHNDHGKYMVVWKKVDGSWKMARDIWNSSMTP